MKSPAQENTMKSPAQENTMKSPFAHKFNSQEQIVTVPVTLDADQIKDVAELTDESINTIKLVLEGINDVLTGDPVGTIRRSPDGRVIAVRVQNLRRPWQTCVPEGYGSFLCNSVHTWPVVYIPPPA